MRQLVLGLVLVLVFVIGLTAGEEPLNQMEKDKAAIQQAAMDYFLGYYEGKAELEERALHPELIKRGYFIIPQNGNGYLRGIGKSAMVEFSRSGSGTQQADSKGEIKVTVLDIFRNTASALIVSNQYHDYLHLVKQDGKWQIVNVLWEPTTPPPPPPAK